MCSPEAERSAKPITPQSEREKREGGADEETSDKGGTSICEGG